MEIRFQTLVEPSRDAVTAKEGEGRRTARTCKLALVSWYTQDSQKPYITFVPRKHCTQFEIRHCTTHPVSKLVETSSGNEVALEKNLATFGLGQSCADSHWPFMLLSLPPSPRRFHISATALQMTYRFSLAALGISLSTSGC
jgi:hypothetical protein